MTNERINLDKATAKHNALYMAVEDIKSRIAELDENNYADHDYKARREALETLKDEMIERCNTAYSDVKAANASFAKAHMMPLPFFIGK